MANKKMNPVDRINLVAMQQERQLFEKRCKVRELERVQKELEKTLNDLKKENEEKQKKLDKKREYNNKMRKINERFKRHVKLIDEHNELLEERNAVAEENCAKELARYEDLLKTYEQKDKEHMQVYEQFPYVPEQKQWSQKLENIKIQVAIEQARVKEQKTMNVVMHRIQQNRLNISVVQFVERVMALWKYQNELEQAKNQKQTLIVRLDSMKEKLALHQSKSMQLEFQVPKSFLEQVGNISNTNSHSSITTSLKELESNLMHKLSKFTAVAKATDSVPRNKLSPFNKDIPQLSQTSLHKSDDLLKKLSQLATLKTIKSSKEKVPILKIQSQNFKPSNTPSKTKISLLKKEEASSSSSTENHMPSIQTPSKQNVNLLTGNKSSPVVKRKRENSESNIKLSSLTTPNIENTEKKDMLTSKNIEKQPKSAAPMKSALKNDEQTMKITPIDKKVRFDKSRPEILSIEIIQPSKNMDVNMVHETAIVENISGNENQNVSLMCADEPPQQSSQNSQIIKNYDLEMAAARSHMSSILEKSPEYPALKIAGFVSPGISSNEDGSNKDPKEPIMDVPSKPSTSATSKFSIFGRKLFENKDNKNNFFGFNF